MGNKSIAAGRDVRTLFDVGAVGGLSDGELLERFVSRQEGGAEPAFSVLLERHGPMVWGVCRRVLGDPNDVADAFQATFLVLVRRAAAIRVEDSLGGWLYGVSRRVALRAKRARLRRFEREVQTGDAPTIPSARSPDDQERSELLAVLDEEIGRLPERYRTALVLCDLNGLKHDAAARQLGCAVGTVGSRLARGREKLRSRLARRGLAPSAGLVTAALSAEAVAAQAPLPSPLARLTIQTVLNVAASSSPFAGVVPASVAALTEGTLRAMIVSKLNLVAIALLATALFGVGTAVHALQSPGAGAGDADVDVAGRLATPEPRTREEPPTQTAKTPQAIPEDSESLRDELELLAIQLKTKQRELAKADATHRLHLAVINTNNRLNERRPGIVSKEQLVVNESEAVASQAMIEIAESEIQEVELRIEQLKRIQRSPDRLGDYLRRHRDADYRRLERRLEQVEEELRQISQIRRLALEPAPTDRTTAPTPRDGGRP